MSTPEQTARFFETQMAVFQRNEEAQRKQMELVDAVIERLGRPAPVAAVGGDRAGSVEDSALRKLQEKDPGFPRYDGNSYMFLPWLVTVDELKNARKLSDQVAIVYATGALGSHGRGIACTAP